MAIVLSQDEYWSLFQEAKNVKSQSDAFDTTYNYPAILGRGFMREIHLRDGLELAIAEYESHEDIITESCDREHPLE